jgi:hypothetical protein
VASAGADTDLSNLTTAGQNAIAQMWLSFNQTGPTVLDSFNVSSVTDNSAGLFTVNIDTDLPNATYVAFAKDTGSTKIQHQHTNSKAVGTIEVRTYNEATTITDLTDTNVIVFGD